MLKYALVSNDMTSRLEFRKNTFDKSNFGTWTKKHTTYRNFIPQPLKHPNHRRRIVRNIRRWGQTNEDADGALSVLRHHRSVHQSGSRRHGVTHVHYVAPSGHLLHEVYLDGQIVHSYFVKAEWILWAVGWSVSVSYLKSQNAGCSGVRLTCFRARALPLALPSQTS